MKTIRNTAHAWVSVYGMAAHAWPVGAVARPVMSLWFMVAGGLIPGIALQQVLDASADPERARAFAWMAVLVVCGLSRGLLAPLWNYVQSGLMRRTTQAMTQALMRASVSAPGVEHTENPTYADNMEAARANATRAGMLADWLASGAGTTASVVAALVVLANVQPLVIVPVAVATLSTAGGIMARSRALAIMFGAIPDRRLARRLAQIATSRSSAQDVRILGLGDWLLRRHKTVAASAARSILRSERGPVAVAAIGAIVQALMLAWGITILALGVADRPGASGKLALGIVVLQAALRQAVFLGTMGADLASNTFSARRLLWLLSYRPAVVTPKAPRAVPSQLAKGIAVDNVSFAYPWGDGRLVLDRVSLTLRAGTTIALVGENGAGKSTLVKLLCRFYDPTSGRITVDGDELRELDLRAWRAACTASFQDFVRLHLVARESIGVGYLKHVEDLVRVREAAVRGGASSVVDRLHNGYETQLGTDFDGGTDLSAGQWQRVALSRSQMRSSPVLVLLDEPTASLDAAAEHALFERYTADARAARERGAITILVSHRFSTVAMAEHIVVLRQGRVVEQGSHPELMAREGRYASLYRMQAAAYA